MMNIADCDELKRLKHRLHVLEIIQERDMKVLHEYQQKQRPDDVPFLNQKQADITLRATRILTLQKKIERLYTE